MEHQKSTGKPITTKILKFLPRATSSVSFQNPQIYSPVKDKKPSEKTHKSNLGIGFSGPMVSIVSPETRRKIKNDVNDSNYTPFYEPTSPRVSCMGQVKCKHYRKLAAAAAAANAGKKPTDKFSRTTSFKPVTTSKNEEHEEKVTKSKKKQGVRRLFGSRRKSGEGDKKSTPALTFSKAPSLGTMKRFSSGRDAFANFDWTTQVTPLEEIEMPASAPVMERNKGVGDDFVRVGVVNVEPRKEINLWKRRTMAQPKPLQLHVASN